jgi:hypothetical protein
MDGKSVLLVVHGMGDAAQGSTLRTSVSKLLEAMRLRMRDKKTVRVEGGSVNEGQRFTDIRYGDATIRVQEYWWAESFIPASSWDVGVWVA